MKKGLNRIRITAKRAAIIEGLRKRGDHPTAEELYLLLKKDFPSISIATVYRNLKILSEFGLVDEIESKNKTRFDANTKQHYHLKCIKCEKIIDLNGSYVGNGFEDIVAKVSKKDDYLITGYRLEFLGICPDCIKKYHYNKEESMGAKTTKIGENEKAVLAALEKLGVCGSKDIVAAANLESKTVSATIKKLKSSGLIASPARCKYSITEQGKEQIS